MVDDFHRWFFYDLNPLLESSKHRAAIVSCRIGCLLCQQSHSTSTNCIITLTILNAASAFLYTFCSRAQSAPDMSHLLRTTKKSAHWFIYIEAWIPTLTQRLYVSVQRRYDCRKLTPLHWIASILATSFFFWLFQSRDLPMKCFSGDLSVWSVPS